MEACVIKLMYKRPDGTYVAEVNGMPYHVMPGDQYWSQAVNEAERMGGDLEFEPLPPAPPTPPMPKLTRRQLRLGLLTNGITTGQVESVIEDIDDDIDREIAKIEWADANTYDRDHPLVNQIGMTLGLDESEIDDMWREAASL